jgi:hypothetical protein
VDGQITEGQIRFHQTHQIAAQVSEQLQAVGRQELVELRKYALNQDVTFAGGIKPADAPNVPAYLELLVRAELVETTGV